MLLEKSGGKTPERIKRQPKQKQWQVVDVTGDGNKVQCCKEQYCIGTWNVRSINQGKLEVIKQEMARVNIHVLGISELRWTGMGEFTSDDHYIYYCGQESLKRNGVALIVNNEFEMQYLGAISKMTEWCWFISKSSQFTVIHVYAPTTDAEEAEVDQFYEDLQDPPELTPEKRCPFHHSGLECKSRKLGDTWSNRQVRPWSTKWSREKANRFLPRKYTGHRKHTPPTTQERILYMDITG